MYNSHPGLCAHSQDIIELSAFGFWIANTLEAAIAINHAVRKTAGVNRVKLVGHCLDESLFVGPPGLLVVHKIWAFSFDTWHGSQ